MNTSKIVALLGCLIVYTQIHSDSFNPQAAEIQSSLAAGPTNVSPSTPPASNSSKYKAPEYNKTASQPTEKATGPAVELPYQESGFHITGQFLYWQTYADNLAYGMNQPATSGDFVLFGEMKKNGYRWDPGIRAGFGYMFSPDTWDTNIEYTYFYNSGGRAGPVKEGHTLQGLFPTDSLGGFPIDKMYSEVHLQYHTLDLTATHTFHSTPSFLMRFSIGGRGAWLTQGFDATYKTDALDVPGFDVDLRTVTHNRWRFSGGGIRAGLLLDWFIAWGFSLHFEGMAAGLLGQYNNLQKVYLRTINDLEFGETGHVKPRSRRIVPNYQLQIGLDWRMAMENLAVKVFGAWELNMWPGLSQIYYYPQVAVDAPKLGSWSRDSINIQGLTAGFVLEF